MNFLQILDDIAQVDPEVYDRLDSRRAIFKNMAGLGQKLSAAALPLAVGAIFNKAYAQTPVGAGVNEVLNFALRLEYFESYFYQARTAAVGFSAANAAALTVIATDEANHVSFLRGVLGNNAIAAPATVGVFDFTARGLFNPTRAFEYLILAQLFEDLGVRAYKGAAPLLISNKTILTAALSIHSVEARHAARIRTMRRGGLNSNTPAQGLAIAPYKDTPKSWISGTDNGGPLSGSGTLPGSTIYGAGNQTNAPTGILYSSEDTTNQAGVSLASLPGTAGFPTAAFSEAFDEGLDAGTVISIANAFTVSGNYFG